MTEIEANIIKAIAYFDIFDFPLTLVEVVKYFPGAAKSLEEIRSVLEESAVLREKLGTKNGFYFLRGRESIISTRLDRYNLAAGKFRRARRVAWVLSFVPFIRLIAVSNNLGFSNASEEGDIDFFVITKSGRIWTARFWSALLLAIFHLRPTKQATKDKICLSFFASEDHLNLEDLTLNENDSYFQHWLYGLVPLYDDEGEVFSQFLAANQWVKKYLPNGYLYNTTLRRRIIPGQISFALKKLKTVVQALVPERFFRSLEERVLAPEIRALANKDTRVVVNDQILKFHTNDRRAEFQNLFEKKLKSQGL